MKRNKYDKKMRELMKNNRGLQVAQIIGLDVFPSVIAYLLLL